MKKTNTYLEKLERLIENNRRIVDTLYRMNRRDIGFSKDDTSIQYYKLVQIPPDMTKEEYYERERKGLSHREWIFDTQNTDTFSYETGTRIRMDEEDFVKNALSQTNHTHGIKVTEEILFTEEKKEHCLQYYKIISSVNRHLEWSEEKSGREYRFQYQHGERYKLTELAVAQQVAKEVNGIVVKVTEEFVYN